MAKDGEGSAPCSVPYLRLCSGGTPACNRDQARNLPARWLDRIVQQEPVAALHHLEAVDDKATDLVLARVAFPILLAAPEPKQDFGNGAIAFATLPGVERTQGQDVKLAKLVRDGSEVGSGTAPIQGAPEPPRGMGAQFQECVHWQGDSVEGSSIGNRFRQPELMRDTINLPDTVPAVIGSTQIKAVEMRQRERRNGCVAEEWCRREQNCLRLKTWHPEQGLLIRGCFRVAWEIATPSVWRIRPASVRLVVLFALSFDSRGDIHHRGGDIPKQSPRLVFGSHVGKPPASANLCKSWRNLPNSGLFNDARSGSFANEM